MSDKNGHPEEQQYIVIIAGDRTDAETMNSITKMAGARCLGRDVGTVERVGRGIG